MRPPPAEYAVADVVDWQSHSPDASRLWCDCSCLPQSHERDVSRDQSKKARISCRQLRKADRALCSSVGPKRLTAVVQRSRPAAAVEAEASAYQVRSASLSPHALPISGKAAAKVALLCWSSADRSSWLRKKRWRWPSKAGLPSSVLAQRLITLLSALLTCWIT